MKPVFKIGREAKALLRQGTLMAKRGLIRRTSAPASVPEVAASSQEKVTIFVHGLGAAGAVFDPMRDRVESDLGHETLDFTYYSYPVEPFERIAARLGRLVDRAAKEGKGGSPRRVQLIGHSFGGLLARWYLQELGGAPKVDCLITLATPHAGTLNARFAIGPLGKALKPGSSLLERIREGRDRADPVAHYAGVAEADFIVTPPESAAALPRAEIVRFEDIGHYSILFEAPVHDFVVDRIAQAQASE